MNAPRAIAVDVCAVEVLGWKRLLYFDSPDQEEKSWEAKFEGPLFFFNGGVGGWCYCCLILLALELHNLRVGFSLGW